MLKVFCLIGIVMLVSGCDNSNLDDANSITPIRNETVANSPPMIEDAANIDSEQVDQSEPSKHTNEVENPVNSALESSSEQVKEHLDEDRSGRNPRLNDHRKQEVDQHMYFIASASLIVAFLLALLVLKLLTWRARFTDGQKFLMPELLHDELTKSSSSIGKFNRKLELLGRELLEDLGSVKEMSQGTRDVAMSFQEKIAAQDLELSSYKVGYSAYMHRKFIGRFFRVYERLQKINGLSENDLEAVNVLFEDAFSEAHVEFFTPEIGGNYPDMTDKIEDDPGVELTDNPDLDFKICSIERNGVRSMENNEQIIVKSKVKVYRLKED